MEQKDKILIIFLAILLVALALCITSLNITGFASKDKRQSDNTKVATFAICEQTDNYIFCKDRLFASCNKTPLEIEEITFYCNNEEYNITKFPSGKVYHDKNWEDPREKDFLTIWAISE